MTCSLTLKCLGCYREYQGTDKKTCECGKELNVIIIGPPSRDPGYDIEIILAPVGANKIAHQV